MRARNGGNKISIARKILVGNGFCTPSSSDETQVHVSSVPLMQWAAGLVQAFHDLPSSLCSSSMTQYLIIRQRSLYNHVLLVCYLRQGFWYREKGIVRNLIEDYRKRFRLFRKCALQSCAAQLLNTQSCAKLPKSCCSPNTF